MLVVDWQRAVFLSVSILFLLVSLALPRLTGTVEILVTAALIVFLGVPHGALDVLYLRKVVSVRAPLGLFLALFAYIAIAASVVILWFLSPFAFLCGFLAASALHFSGDPETGASLPTRIVYGAGVIALPSLLHGAELTRLYALLTNESVATAIVSTSFVLGCGVLGLAIVALVLELRTGGRIRALELGVVISLMTFAPPLWAFTIYFCLMHSARHIVRTSDLIVLPKRAFFVECLLPMAGVFLSGAIAWSMRATISFDAGIIQVVFVSLAALTAPHMVIIEPIRFGGWKRAAGAT